MDREKLRLAYRGTGASTDWAWSGPPGQVRPEYLVQPLHSLVHDLELPRPVSTLVERHVLFMDKHLVRGHLLGAVLRLAKQRQTQPFRQLGSLDQFQQRALRIDPRPS